MDSIASQRAGDLQASVRSWLEGLFGRPLAPDEEVTIMAFPPHLAPKTPDSAAVKRIEATLDEAARNMKSTTSEQFESAVHEAMQHVRKRIP